MKRRVAQPLSAMLGIMRGYMYKSQRVAWAKNVGLDTSRIASERVYKEIFLATSKQDIVQMQMGGVLNI